MGAYSAMQLLMHWCTRPKYYSADEIFLAFHQCHTEILQLYGTILDNNITFWKKKTLSCLTHWGQVTHICASKLTIMSSDNGLSPGRGQAIIWTNARTLLIWPLGTNFSEILIEIYIFSFKKTHLKMSSGKWLTSCLGLNVLKVKWTHKRVPHTSHSQMGHVKYNL